jgi:spore coat protein U-like protein
MTRPWSTVAKLLLALLALVAGHGSAWAQATCTLSVSPLNFGAYTGTQLQVTGSVDLLCSGTNGSRANYTVTASAGNSNNYAQRFLKRTTLPADTINYSLAIVLGNGTSANWGNGTGGTSTWTGRTAPINGGNPQRVASTTFTGTLAAGNVPSSGNYTDVIVVTATWN